MTKKTEDHKISLDELIELVEYLVTPRIRDARYRELLDKYDEEIATRNG